MTREPQRTHRVDAGSFTGVPDRLAVTWCALFQLDDNNHPAVVAPLVHLDSGGDDTLNRFGWLIDESGGDIDLVAVRWWLVERDDSDGTVDTLTRIGVWFAFSGTVSVEFGFELDLGDFAQRELASGIGWLEELAVSFTPPRRELGAGDVVFLNLSDNPLRALFGYGD